MLDVLVVSVEGVRPVTSGAPTPGQLPESPREASPCTSMCRGSTTACTRNTVGSPNAYSDSRIAPCTAAGSWAAVSTRRMPRPPPLATALTNTGNGSSPGRGEQLPDIRARCTGSEHGQAGLAGGGDRPRLVAGQLQHRRQRTDEHNGPPGRT